MKTRFARRIAGLATIEIALVSAAVIIAGALFAFGAYVRGVSNELERDARAAAQRDDAHVLTGCAGGRTICIGPADRQRQRNRFSRRNDPRHGLSRAAQRSAAGCRRASARRLIGRSARRGSARPSHRRIGDGVRSSIALCARRAALCDRQIQRCRVGTNRQRVFDTVADRTLARDRLRNASRARLDSVRRCGHSTT